MGEDKLIKSIQCGNKRAFNNLMNSYGEQLMNIAYGLTKNTQDAEDLYQDTFIKIYKNIKSFRFESKFYTWAYRIMVNQAYNLYEKKKKKQTMGIYNNAAFWFTVSDEEREEIGASHSPLKNEVNEALMQLSPKQRTIFILKHYQGKKIKDIAALLDISEGTIKRYLFRATRKLQKLLCNERMSKVTENKQMHRNVHKMDRRFSVKNQSFNMSV